MPDWKEEVCRRMPELGIDATRQAEVVEELALHLESAFEEALACGASRRQARQAALSQLPDWRLLSKSLRPLEARQVLRPPPELSRGVRLPLGPVQGEKGMWSDLWRDWRYGLRTLGRRPAFATVAVLTLALGIGANTAIFSLVEAVLLRPLPYPEPDRLVMLWESNTQGQYLKGDATGPDFRAWREGNRSFQDLAAFSPTARTYTGGREPERLPATAVTVNLFQVMGVEAQLGRTFAAEEGRMGAEKAVVLSHGLWTRLWGADKKILGQQILLNGESYQVVGVMPPGFGFPSRAQLWLPLAEDHPAWQEPREHFLTGIGRLKAGVDLQSARQDLDSVAQRLRQEFPQRNRFRGVYLSPLEEEAVGGARASLLVLMAAVGLVLLIACTNVAHLLMGRNLERRREISVRAALGAGRRRLLCQLLSETLLLFLGGGVLGMVLAYWAVDLFLNFAGAALPRQEEAGINLQVMGFALGVSLLSGVLFGLAPAWQAFRLDLLQSLKKSEGTASKGPGSGWMVSMEVAFSLILLLGAGLMLNSFYRLLSVDPGFDPQRLLVMEIVLPESRYPEVGQQDDFARQTLLRLRSLPGVQAASLTSLLPLEGDFWRYGLLIEGRPLPADDSEKARADYRLVDPEYFRTMGIPLLRGRGLNDEDRPDSPKVLLVNQSMARRYWPGQDPLGQRLDFALCRPAPCSIVGVVGDTRHFGLDREESPAVYALHRQKSMPWMSQLFFLLRTSGDPLEAVSAAKQQIWSLDAELPFRRILTMEQKLSDTVADRRLLASLLAAFALTALILATVGVYGVISHSVCRQLREIGIRMALGAARQDVLWMVVRRGMRLTLIGAAIGLAGAVGLTRFFAGMLFGISQTDPPTYAAVLLLLLGVSLAACWLPARRATRVDPLTVLRYE